MGILVTMGSGLAHLGDRKADELSSGAQMFIVASNDSKHERADEEALNLDPPTTKNLDEEDGEEVPWHVSGRGDYQISISVLEERVVFGFAFGETDRSQKHGLVEIDTVKGDVDQEPAGCGADQLFQMSPLAEVDQERLQLHVSSRWRNVCFNNRSVSVLRGKTVRVCVRSMRLGAFAGVVHGCS